ncbi:MAG: LysR family transcriptional regulator [Myxococcota bacterium]
MNLRMEDLITFEVVGREGGFSGAARTLNQTPSAITRSIARLESSLGARLFHRSTRSVALTAEGERLRPHARKLIAGVEEAERDVSRVRDKVAGTLRLTASATFARLYLAPILNELSEQHPDLRYELVLTDTVLDLVSSGLDLAVRIGPLADSELQVLKIADERRMVCASPRYLERHGEPSQPSDLLHHRTIVVGEADTWTFRGRQRTVRVYRGVRTDFGDFARQAAEAGLGLAQLPGWLVNPSLASGRLVRVLERYEASKAGVIAVLYPSREWIAPRVRAFLTLVRRRLIPPPW